MGRNLLLQSSSEWFCRLRLVAFTVLCLLVGVTHFAYQATLPLVPLALLLSLIPLSHLACLFLVPSERATPYLLVLDVLILSGVLALTGGAANPFSIVYLVHVVLAALLLGKVWAWIVATLSSICFSALFFSPYTGQMLGMHHGHGSGGGELSFHLYGMLFSYVLVAMAVAYFVSRIVDELRDRERAFNELKGSQDKLLSLASLSANAAHELSTPLATMEVVIHELERVRPYELKGQRLSDFERDLALLNGEVKRCKAILSDLCMSSGNITGEMPSRIPLVGLKEKFQKFMESSGDQIDWECVGDNVPVVVPLRPILLAVKGLIVNALDATVGIRINDSVKVSFAVSEAEQLLITVRDHGTGMSTSVQHRVGEPFFSTKLGGMGLGVYIAKLVAEQCGGKIWFESTQGDGTTAYFRVPSATGTQQVAA